MVLEAAEEVMVDRVDRVAVEEELVERVARVCWVAQEGTTTMPRPTSRMRLDSGPALSLARRFHSQSTNLGTLDRHHILCSPCNW